MTGAAGPNSGFNGGFMNAGVFGTSDQQPGVVGTSSGSSGVLGQAGDAAGVAPAGVCGTSQHQIGVYASSSGSRGVFGESEVSIGVHGASQRSIGVLGWSAQPGPAFGGGNAITPAGVIGTSAANPGVIGTTQTSYGVIGQAGEPQGAGISPTAVLATSAKGVGVAAFSRSQYGIIAISGQPGPLFRLPSSPTAIWGTSAAQIGVAGSSTNTYGVYGQSSQSDGVRGESFAGRAATTPLDSVPAGVFGRSLSNGFGVLGVTPTASAAVVGVSTGPGAGIYGIAPPEGKAGYFEGDVTATGTISGKVKNAIVPFPDGSHRALHRTESPETPGSRISAPARLKRGRAAVKLDGDFAKVIRTNAYLVFLTPEGDCAGLDVKSKGSKSFEVRELNGGAGNVAFSYRIVGKRKDVTAKRFAKIDIAGPMQGGAKPPRPPAPLKASVRCSPACFQPARPLRKAARRSAGRFAQVARLVREAASP